MSIIIFVVLIKMRLGRQSQFPKYLKNKWRLSLSYVNTNKLSTGTRKRLKKGRLKHLW